MMGREPSQDHGSKEFKAVVVLMGANDRQAIRSGEFRLCLTPGVDCSL